MTHLIETGQFMVLCAVRESFRHEYEEQQATAREVSRLAPEISRNESAMLIRDIETEISYYNDVDRCPTEWLGATAALGQVLNGASDGGGRDVRVGVDPRVILGAVRYALGRRTYIVQMVGEEIIRIAGGLDLDTSAAVAADLTNHLATVKGPIMAWDDDAVLERAAQAVADAGEGTE